MTAKIHLHFATRRGYTITFHSNSPQSDHHHVFLWNSMIRDEASKGSPRQALYLYQKMKGQGIPPNNYTFPFVLKACAALRDLTLALQIHSQITLHGFQSNGVVATALVDAYGKCNSADDAHQLFDEMRERDVVSWTALISAFSLNGLTNQAFEAFNRLNRDRRGCLRGGHDPVTLASLLSACATDSGFCIQVRGVHGFVMKCGFESNTRVANTLIDVYSKCRVLDDAQRVFDLQSFERDVVSWNAMISGFARGGDPEQALCVFGEMLATGAMPNRVTLLIVLKSCSELGCSKTSLRMHRYTESWLDDNGSDGDTDGNDDVLVLTALVDMHSKCGNLELAHQIFDGIKKKNVVCWSAMIAGYEQNLMPEMALQAFQELLNLDGDVKPNEVSMVSVISACSCLGASRQGKMTHKYVVQTGLDAHASVRSALIDMYAKCGEIELARRVFANIPRPELSVVSWSTMISAEGMHGEGKQALQLFADMQEQGICPNEVTFVSLLSACSHAGLVEEGRDCFSSIQRDHNISPTVKHYACMVDLLGRAGLLNEAHDLICRMPIEADAGVWGCLLGACRLHGHCELGERVEKKILALDPRSVGHQVLLANLYGAAGRWDDVVRMRVLLREKGLRKAAGCSFIEIGAKVYSFTVEDRSHPDSEMIYKKLQDLDEMVREAGFSRDKPAAFVGIHPDLEENVKEDLVKYHSEKLAIAFGIMNAAGSGDEPIRISKNLRICRDCHAYATFVSKVTKREMIIRDARRFHHFKDGSCSCRDYW